MTIEEKIAAMLLKAQAAKENAYAPYSKFKVGACINTIKDEFFAGCNVENAAYPLTQCAEAGAIGNMIAMNGANQITEVVIISSGDKPCVPCGACRQRIREFAQENTQVHMFSNDANTKITMTLSELLPESFGPEFLHD